MRFKRLHPRPLSHLKGRERGVKTLSPSPVLWNGRGGWGVRAFVLLLSPFPNVAQVTLNEQADTP